MTSMTEDAMNLTVRLSPVLGPGAQRDKKATAYALCSAARRYAKIQERWCNEEMDDVVRERLERRESLLESQMTEYAKLLGAESVIFGGDPRGATVKLVIPGYEHIYDCWGKEGVCVPGS